MSEFDPNDPFNDSEFEFETVEAQDLDAVDARVQASYKKQMVTLEKLILPFMKNLMKNPESETIKWPNREAPIKAQMSKIAAITKTILYY